MQAWLTTQWESLAALWRGVAPQSQDSLIATSFTIVLATAAALLVVRRIGKHAARTIEGNRIAEAMRLKREIYRDLQAAIGGCVDARLKLRSYVEEFRVNVDLYRKDKSAKWAPSARPPDLLALFSGSRQAAAALVGLIGRLKIVEPRMAVFPTAFSAALHDSGHAFQAYCGPAFRSMAVQAKEDGTFSWTAPNDKEYERLERVSLDFLRTLDVFGAYLGDLETEAQNALLGELFRRQLPARTAAHPGDIVIRLDRHKELAAHFEQNSPWGVEKAIAPGARGHQPDGGT